MSVKLTIELDQAVADELRQLAEATGRAVDELHRLALLRFVEEERVHVQAILDGVHDAEGGSLVPHAAVQAWIQERSMATESAAKVPFRRAS